MAHTLIRIPKTAAHAFISIADELTVSNRQDLKHAVLHALDEGERRFVFDFSHCRNIDSSGLGVLFAMHKRIRERGGSMTLRHLDANLYTLMELTKLVTIFDIQESASA